MRRQMQILCIAAAAVVAGGTLWAVASSDMLGRFGLSPSAPTKDASIAPRSGERVAAVPAPKAQGTGAARRSADAVAIETARIEAGGASVIAGRSPPNHRIVVLGNGREIATAVASDEGQWSVIVSDGIAAGPLELSVSASPASGGPAVVSAPQQLVVPPSSSPTGVATAPPARVWAPPMAAGGPAARSPPANAAVAPGERVQSGAHVRVPAQGTEATADKQALERFAALVERARTDAAAAAKREGSGASAPNMPPPSGLGATVAAPLPSGATVTAAANAPSTRASATDARPEAPIPLPITFMTDEIELTADGARAAALLAEYLRLKRPEGISLSGHADSRGPDGYNMDLSKRRLEAIEQYLRRTGYAGKLSLTPKGKREPYIGLDRTRLSLQEAFQADRRVELRLMQ